MVEYNFTNNWFKSVAKDYWDQLIPRMRPIKILEIGSFEGASACYLIEKLAIDREIEIHCVDTWEGGIEHQPNGGAQADMSTVYSRFKQNIQVALDRVNDKANVYIYQGPSDFWLSKFLAENKRNYFDFIYVDGSHQAPDVLCDAVLGFRLLRIGGIMAFDDYLWYEVLPSGKDPIRCPKPAIDAFTNLYFRKTKILEAPLYQLYVQKLSD